MCIVIFKWKQEQNLLVKKKDSGNGNRLGTSRCLEFVTNSHTRLQGEMEKLNRTVEEKDKSSIFQLNANM